jgi:hypothetical protein
MFSDSSGYSEFSTSTNRDIALKSNIFTEEFALDDGKRIQRFGKRLKREERGKNYREYRSNKRGRFIR